MISPTQYMVRKAKYERECDAARERGDIEGMSRALGKLTRLLEAVHGQQPNVATTS